MNYGDRLLLSVKDAAASLSIGRNLCYELIAQGHIPHVRLGRRILVPRAGLETWIARESGVDSAPPNVVSSRPQPPD